MKHDIPVYFLLLLLLPLSLNSQQPDTIALHEVRVVSSILDVLQRQSGRSVSIVTTEQIRQASASTIDEIIRYIPGLENQSRNLYGVQTDYSIRGSTFNQVLVMIDGMRLNDPLTGHFNGYIPLPLSEVSRIEVIRGPAAVMYGPDAVGGVINIITTNYTLQSDTLAAFNISTGAGAHKLFYTDAGTNRSYRNWKFGGGFRVVSSEGYPSASGFRDDFNLRIATASVSGTPGKKWRVFFRIAADDRNFSARRFYTISPSDTAREIVRSWWNHLGIMYTGNKSTTFFDAAHKSGSDEYRFNPLSPANQHSTQQIGLQLRNNRDVKGNLRVVTGINGNYRAIESNDRGDHHEFYGGVYSLAFLSVSRYMHLSGGARVEADPYQRIVFLPHINLARSKGPLTIRALAGKTLRTPDFTERYVSTNLPDLSPGRNLGNPSLRSESSWSLEAGGDVSPLPSLSAGITFFARYGNDLIDYIFTPSVNIPVAQNLRPDGSYFYARNIGTVNTKGIELTLNGSHFLRNVIQIEYNAGYSFQESYNPDGELSKYVSNQARQLFSFSSHVKYGKADIGLSAILKQRDRDFAESIGVSLNPSYQVFNVRFGYDIIAEKLSLQLKVENLFNEEYSDILGAMLPGRWVSGGVRVSL